MWRLSVAFHKFAIRFTVVISESDIESSKTKFFSVLKIKFKMPRPLFYRNGCWDPLQERNLFNQNTDLPGFLEPDEVSWIDSARKRLGTSTWPGSVRLPLFSSLCMEIPPKSCTGPEGRVSESVCEQMKGPQNWKVCLDVSPFSPKEISIKTKEGYLEITGMLTLICLALVNL